MRANEEAIREYQRIVKQKQVECDLEEADSYVYSQDEEALIKETEAVSALGCK